MVVEGIVFRVVTDNYPGCPKLAAKGAPCIRTEYLTNQDAPWEWSLDRKDAFHFLTHLDAETVAGKIGHCHASVVSAESDRLPERLVPRPEAEAPSVTEPKRRRRSPKTPGLKIDLFRLGQLRREPVEAD